MESSPASSGAMAGRFIESVYRSLELEAGSRKQFAVLRQRFLSVKKQFPWVYGIFIVNVLAIDFAVVPAGYDGFRPTPLFLAIITARLIHWVRLGNRHVADEKLQRHLVASYVVACCVCTMFCAWLIFLYASFASEQPANLVMFASMTAVGIFYGLSGFPAAARAPIYFLNVPLAVVLVTSRDPSQMAMSLALSLLVVLMLRMLLIQDRAFVRLVTTSFDIDTRRRSAVESERSALEEQARFSAIANTDPLTGLYNRRGLMGALAADPAIAIPWGLVILDLDGFKPINDTFGHAAGDGLLIEVAARLTAALGPRDCAARIGGDEFAIVCHSTSAGEAAALAQRVVKSLGEPYAVGTRAMSVSSCAGVSWKGAGGAVGRQANSLHPRSSILLRSDPKRTMPTTRLAAGRHSWFDYLTLRHSVVRLAGPASTLPACHSRRPPALPRWTKTRLSCHDIDAAAKGIG